MLIYPDIDPVVFGIGPLEVRWYGLMYMVGFLGFWWLARQRAKLERYPLQPEQVADLLFYGILGVVLGGRIGYTLFYNLPAFLDNPWVLFKIWEGGMAFHGGLLGVIIALWWWGRRHRLTLLQMGDFVAPMVPIGLGAGRIGNFINGELWGRPTDLPWGMVFPYVDRLPRHPSQLYEFLLEGVLLFVLLWWFSRQTRPLGAVSGLFLLLYGVFRFLVEFVREPDAHIGFIAWGWLTVGQLLTLPMILIGMAMLGWAYIRRRPASAEEKYQ